MYKTFESSVIVMTHFPHVLQQTGHQTLTSTITELQWVHGELFNGDLTSAANKEDVQFVQARILHYQCFKYVSQISCHWQVVGLIFKGKCVFVFCFFSKIQTAD